MIWLALRNLVSEKTRFAMSAAGIGFSVFLITIQLGLYQGWNQKVGGFVERVEVDAWVAREGTTDFINAASILPDSLVTELEADAEVESAHEMIVRPMAFDMGDKKVEVHLIGYDTASGAGGPDSIKKGEPPQGNQIVLDEVLARTSGVEVGDRLASGDFDIEVSGISTGGNFAFTQAGFMPIETARQLLQMEGLSTFDLVSLRDDTNIESWRTRTEAAHDGTVVFTSDEFASATRHRILDNVIPIIGLIVGLAFVVGIAITSLTIYTTTVEKTREFGVMKAIGFNNFDLYKLVIAQSLITGGFGFIFGALCTFLLSRFVDRLVAQFIVSVRPIDLAMVLGATLLMALGAAIVPARKVGGVDPAVVFRG